MEMTFWLEKAEEAMAEVDKKGLRERNHDKF